MEPSAAWVTTTSSSPGLHPELGRQAAAEQRPGVGARRQIAAGDQVGCEVGHLPFLGGDDAEQFGRVGVLAAGDQAEGAQPRRGAEHPGALAQVAEQVAFRDEGVEQVVIVQVTGAGDDQVAVVLLGGRGEDVGEHSGEDPEGQDQERRGDDHRREGQERAAAVAPDIAQGETQQHGQRALRFCREKIVGLDADVEIDGVVVEHGVLVGLVRRLHGHGQRQGAAADLPHVAEDDLPHLRSASS